jgi:F1F0 ATPase subunit 2
MMTLVTFILSGAALGIFFYGGLWFSVRRAFLSASPFRWLGYSFLLRTAVALAGFYLAVAGGWLPLLACLAGFTAARFAVLYGTRLYDTKGSPVNRGGAG